MSKNEITIKNDQGYISPANFNVSEGFAEELAGLDSGFDRIKIPAGGGTSGASLMRYWFAPRATFLVGMSHPFLLRRS